MVAGKRARRYTVQALDRDDALVTSTRWFKTQQDAEESAARLVRINGALCWIVYQEGIITRAEWSDTLQPVGVLPLGDGCQHA